MLHEADAIVLKNVASRTWTVRILLEESDKHEGVIRINNLEGSQHEDKRIDVLRLRFQILQGYQPRSHECPKYIQCLGLTGYAQRSNSCAPLLAKHTDKDWNVRHDASDHTNHDTNE